MPGLHGLGAAVGAGSGKGPGGADDHPAEPGRPRKHDRPARAEQELGQLLSELLTEDRFEEIEQQAEEWSQLGDDEAESELLTWGLRRNYVHLQVLDHIASGAGGQARIHSVIRATNSFGDQLVKILKGRAAAKEDGKGKPDHTVRPAPRPKK